MMAERQGFPTSDRGHPEIPINKAFPKSQRRIATTTVYHLPSLANDPKFR
jgi:hypothetical protein